MKVIGTETDEATFTDSQGNETTVTVNSSRVFNSDYLYVNYSYEGDTFYTVVNRDTGVIREIKEPNT